MALAHLQQYGQREVRGRPSPAGGPESFDCESESLYSVHRFSLITKTREEKHDPIELPTMSPGGEPPSSPTRSPPSERGAALDESATP